MKTIDNSLFTDGIVAQDPVYNLIRDERNDQRTIESRVFTDEMWEKYQPYADPNFRQEIQIDFHARFWEMYLTCACLDKSLPVRRRISVQGPDVLIQDEMSNIWIEAIAPSRGAEKNPDRVPDYKFNGTAQNVPNDQIILRYRHAIAEKFDNKYQQYLSDSVIDSSDPYIIAINSCKIFEAGIADTDPPRIIKAVFPIGYQRITITRDTMNIVDSGFQFRPAIERTSGELISTNLFVDKMYECLSGILISHASGIRLIKPLGADFIFIHNPLAKNPAPLGFFKIGREYTACENPDGSYTVSCRDWNMQ